MAAHCARCALHNVAGAGRRGFSLAPYKTSIPPPQIPLQVSKELKKGLRVLELPTLSVMSIISSLNNPISCFPNVVHIGLHILTYLSPLVGAYRVL